MWELLAEDVVDVVEGERRRRRRAEDALAVEVAGERWRLSRVWELRWRRRRLLRLWPRWLRPVVVGGAGAAVRGCEGAAWEAVLLGLWMLPEMLVVVAVLAWRWLVAEQWKCV